MRLTIKFCWLGPSLYRQHNGSRLLATMQASLPCNFVGWKLCNLLRLMGIPSEANLGKASQHSLFTNIGTEDLFLQYHIPPFFQKMNSFFFVQKMKPSYFTKKKVSYVSGEKFFLYQVQDLLHIYNKMHQVIWWVHWIQSDVIYS